MKFIKFIMMLFCCLYVNVSLAAPLEQDPILLLTSISQNLFTALKQERPQVKTHNDEWIYKIVERIILPHVDLEGMSRSVLGREAWYQSSPQQRSEFSHAFTRVVVKTYASALDAYTDETIKFFPIRGGLQGERRVLVNSQVLHVNGPPVPLDYRLIRFDQRWKIYDLNVEGVSLLQSFYSQFMAELSTGKTVDQLTQELKERHAS